MTDKFNVQPALLNPVGQSTHINFVKEYRVVDQTEEYYIVQGEERLEVIARDRAKVVVISGYIR